MTEAIDILGKWQVPPNVIVIDAPVKMPSLKFVCDPDWGKRQRGLTLNEIIGTHEPAALRSLPRPRLL